MIVPIILSACLSVSTTLDAIVEADEARLEAEAQQQVVIEEMADEEESGYEDEIAYEESDYDDESDYEEEADYSEEESSEGQEAEGDMEYLGTFTISAYNYEEGHYATASGAEPTPYQTVAMNGLPFGTVLYIDGVGYVTVEDRGGFPDDWIDLHIGHDSCSSWGMPRCDVYIVH